jgi:hypothetical protein
MKTQCVLAILILQLAATSFAQNSSLPFPPPEFFAALSKTKIIPGKYCCDEPRAILARSVVISPYLAAKLFLEGKLIIGDANSRETYDRLHILGAISLPYNQVDFMNLKPIARPIALY